MTLDMLRFGIEADEWKSRSASCFTAVGTCTLKERKHEVEWKSNRGTSGILTERLNF